MFQSDRQWELFGYDMRQLGRHWRGAWRDLLRGADSPLRQHLDEVVAIRSDCGTTYYQGGRPCGAGRSQCKAILLPSELVLSKVVRFPVAYETDLDAAMALEVGASSPFLPDDMASGWEITSRDDNFIHVVVVIVSLSAVMTYLGRQFDAHDPHAQEVWAQVDDSMIVIRGFGETLRDKLYRQRLLRCAALVVISALLLLGIVGVGTLFSGLKMERYETMAASIEREAAKASQFREQLLGANETILAANEVVALYPNPQVEIARLTRLLGDEVSLASISMKGFELSLRGRAVNAASVMKQISDEDAYSEVNSPQAITSIGNTGFEQFDLELTLRGGDSG